MANSALSWVVDSHGNDLAWSEAGRQTELEPRHYSHPPCREDDSSSQRLGSDSGTHSCHALYHLPSRTRQVPVSPQRTEPVDLPLYSPSPRYPSSTSTSTFTSRRPRQTGPQPSPLSQTHRLPAREQQPRTFRSSRYIKFPQVVATSVDQSETDSEHRCYPTGQYQPDAASFYESEQDSQSRWSGCSSYRYGPSNVPRDLLLPAGSHSSYFNAAPPFTGPGIATRQGQVQEYQLVHRPPLIWDSSLHYTHGESQEVLVPPRSSSGTLRSVNHPEPAHQGHWVTYSHSPLSRSFSEQQQEDTNSQRRRFSHRPPLREFRLRTSRTPLYPSPSNPSFAPRNTPMASTTQLDHFPNEAPSSPAQTLVASPHIGHDHSPASTIGKSKSYRDASTGKWSSKEGAVNPRVLTYKDPQDSSFERPLSGDSSGFEDPTTAAPEQMLSSNAAKNKKGLRFWLIMVTLMIVIFLSAVDLTIISTALPTIVKELPASKVSPTWVTSAFLLTVTAFQPFMGGLADVIGRRYSLLLCIALFLGGSVICALAKSMLILVVGRGVQGLGGGGIQAIVEIIISDITTLRERGMYMGTMGLVFAISSLVAPILGGVFSKHDWRWIFWINLPIGGIAAIFCIPFLRLAVPPMKLKEQIARMDIFGNLVLLGSVISILIAVTEGGIEHPWSAMRIWLPLVMGMVGLIAFFLIEFIPNPLARDPILPLRLFKHPTAALSFFLTFVHGIIFYGAIYILPVYFQAIKDASPLQSAFDILPSTSPSPPAAVLAGLIMAITGKYKVQMIFWWGVMTVGFGLTYIFDIGTPMWQWVCFQLISGTGVGAIFALTLPPIQASLPVSEIAHATATFAFSRSFGSVWGIAAATAIFTTTIAGQLKNIPAAMEVGLTAETALGWATELNTLPTELREPVREAFAYAIRRALIMFIPLCGIGFIASFFLTDIPLPDFNESEHGIVGSEKTANNGGSPSAANTAAPADTVQRVQEDIKAAAGAAAAAASRLAPMPAPVELEQYQLQQRHDHDEPHQDVHRTDRAQHQHQHQPSSSSGPGGHGQARLMPSYETMKTYTTETPRQARLMPSQSTFASFNDGTSAFPQQQQKKLSSPQSDWSLNGQFAPVTHQDYGYPNHTHDSNAVAVASAALHRPYVNYGSAPSSRNGSFGGSAPMTPMDERIAPPYPTAGSGGSRF